MTYSHGDLVVLAENAYGESTLTGGGVEVLVDECEGSDGILNVCFAFRGTEKNGSDILSDARGFPWHDSLIGWCHKGFLIGVRHIWPILARRMDTYENSSRFWFCGHSKGGAEATIVAAMAVMRTYPVENLTTFGSPRPGFAQLGKILSVVPGEHYVYGNDAVTTHPWRVWGFRHRKVATHIGVPGNRYKDHRIRRYRRLLTGDPLAVGEPVNAAAGASRTSPSTTVRGANRDRRQRG